MAALGRMGRFGNQVFQYAFLRLCARASGARAECPRWVGQALFGHDDPSVTIALPPLVEIDSSGESLFDVVPEFIPYIEKMTGKRAGRIGVEAIRDGAESGDLIGFFQWHTSHLRPHRDFFRSLFQPREDLSAWIDEPLKILRQRGKTIVAIHLRSGDYKWLPQLGFTLAVPPEWWVEWLASHWSELDDPVLYLCSEKVGAVRHHFRKYNPVTADDLELTPPDRLKATSVDFYRDYYVMTQADVLGVSNSTFSFSAAMLNEKARMFVRPHWDLATRFTQFDPWNSDPLLFMPGGRRRLIKDYGAMLAVARETNGFGGMLASALVYHPAGMLFTASMRLRLAYGGHGWRGVRDFALGRNARKAAP